MRQILILGGGSGGGVAANRLVKNLKGEDVDRSPYHDFMPSFPWVALGFKALQMDRKLAELRAFRNASLEGMGPS